MDDDEMNRLGEHIEARDKLEKYLDDPMEKVRRGEMSTKELKKQHGQKAGIRGVGRVYSKYTRAEQKEMTKKPAKVKNPKQILQAQQMHEKWLRDKLAREEKRLAEQTEA